MSSSRICAARRCDIKARVARFGVQIQQAEHSVENHIMRCPSIAIAFQTGLINPKTRLIGLHQRIIFPQHGRVGFIVGASHLRSCIGGRIDLGHSRFVAATAPDAGA